MKCKDCSCCHSAVYKRYHPSLGYRNVGVFECWGVQEPFEIDDISAECPAYPERREIAQDECTYCNKNKYNGGFNIQVAHVKRDKIEYTHLEPNFCPICGKKLEG